jgi:hypothetical protein
MLEFFGFEFLAKYCIGLLYNLKNGVYNSETSESIFWDTMRYPRRQHMSRRI